MFECIPKRPEEVGDWWLVRRRGFNVHSWRSVDVGVHILHMASNKICNSCSCGLFTSFLCLGCDGKYEEHETTFESKEERRREGRTVGMAFKPFSEHRDIQQSVFNGGGGGTSNISHSMKSLTMSSSHNDNGGMSPEEMYSSGMINSDQYFQMISSSSTTDNNNNNNNNRSIVAQRNAMRAMQQKQPPISDHTMGVQKEVFD